MLQLAPSARATVMGARSVSSRFSWGTGSAESHAPSWPSPAHPTAADRASKPLATSKLFSKGTGSSESHNAFWPVKERSTVQAGLGRWRLPPASARPAPEQVKVSKAHATWTRSPNDAARALRPMSLGMGSSESHATMWNLAAKPAELDVALGRKWILPGSLGVGSSESHH